ncbi:cytochrome c biogenesis protein [Limnochorda pilosa]|uniref:Heme exporter protein C n=1 Tax=Limnochorda pilosa TaxID=1555112 RepID=A0A0K2SJH5_LIMPI|nr:cytochrome c biogenesis protein CcsA [Limnochorda pilosa]BAS27263.1 cytochrome C assembly protein [Limnochorda pilosa]
MARTPAAPRSWAPPRWLAALTAVLVFAGLYLALVYAPPERTMGDVQRIFYFHVASAWNAFLAFLVVAVASAAYLRTRRPRWDDLAYASAEVGVLFTTLTLMGGTLWMRPVWNTWWTWDPRLTTTLILWFIYLGYLLLRSFSEGGERQARLAAVYGIVGFLDVPVVYLSSVWWRGIHPSPAETEFADPMVLALVANVVAYTALYAYVTLLRARQRSLEDRVAALRESLR